MFINVCVWEIFSTLLSEKRLGPEISNLPKGNHTWHQGKTWCTFPKIDHSQRAECHVVCILWSPLWAAEASCSWKPLLTVSVIQGKATQSLIFYFVIYVTCHYFANMCKARIPRDITHSPQCTWVCYMNVSTFILLVIERFCKFETGLKMCYQPCLISETFSFWM